MIKGLRRLYRFSTVRDRIKLERQTRLAKGIDAKTLTTKSQDDINKIRNIGIIAHIDAGKTTTSERMLYYAGALPSPGDIDDGTTAMDFMVQERERGITIRSAAISFNWLGHQINLIDTPGHVDFSGEVTRSLRVLDGVVTILDAVKGVESQTGKVWAQATKHKIPKLVFLNKMDRIGSSASQSINSLRNRLGVDPLVLQLPLGDGDSFKGVIDLFDLQQITFAGRYGQQVNKSKLEKNTERHNQALKARLQLIQAVGNYDDEIADMYLKQQPISSSKLKTALRKILISQTHSTKVCPVLMGASYRNLGVQPLLDSIISYLPSPSDRQAVSSTSDQTSKRTPSRTQPLLGYVFKVMYDFEKGPLAFTRFYSGYLNKNFEIYNVSKKANQKVAQVLRVRANNYVPINEISAGDIVALSGLKQTFAGDTLTLNTADEFLLQNLDIPNPVFTAPFQLETAKYKRQFDEAMNRSVIEDTSLSYKYEVQTNQYLVSGLGELHLEILRDRLTSEGIPVKMGSLRINFKQTISTTKQDTFQIKNEIKPTVFEQFVLQIRVLPLRTADGKIDKKNQITFAFERVPQFDKAWEEFKIKKIIAKTPSARNNYTKQQLSGLRKNLKNPTPLEPLDPEQDQQDGEEGNMNEQQNEQDEDEDDSEDEQKEPEEEPYFHMNTLPFQTLYELVQICQTSMSYGRNKLPATGIQLQITNGKYKRTSFSKSVMNKCASSLVRKVLDSSTVLIEPIMQFTLEGDEAMIDVAIKDILKKRGRVQQQSAKRLTGFIPAEGVRGWISQLRSMGLQIQIKFSDYEQVSGVNPEKLINDNNN